MNDTILTSRQKTILNLVNQSEGVSRDEIEEKILGIYGVSKPTIIRDLNLLLSCKLIRVEGKARSVKYYPRNANPLLRAFEVDRYFQDDPDIRLGVKEGFDFQIFNRLNGLFSDEEVKFLYTAARSFSNTEIEKDQTVFKRELERFVIELSWKSSKIEGNTYSLLETETLIKERQQAKGKKKEETTMILNHKSAFETILKNRHDFKKLKLSTVNQLHNVLVKELNIDLGIRKRAVGVTGTRFRPLDNEFQIREAMEKMIKAINRLSSPYDKALAAASMIPYIQPFNDGNKRTARMLANAILLANDLYPLSYRSVGEDDFKKALILFYEQGSIVAIKNIFIEQFIFANRTYFIG